jgi:hypothetical protein
MKKIDTHNEGVYSPDVFQVLVDYEITRSRRYPSPLALLQIAVKPIASHEAALESAPEIFLSALSHHLRSVDIPSKTGNAFKILLPTTDESGARAVCERLLSVFKNKFDVPSGSSIAFSLQIGSTAHGGGSTLSGVELFQKAEEALKQSKLKGPNTYVMSV